MSGEATWAAAKIRLRRNDFAPEAVAWLESGEAAPLRRQWRRLGPGAYSYLSDVLTARFYPGVTRREWRRRVNEGMPVSWAAAAEQALVTT